MKLFSMAILILTLAILPGDGFSKPFTFPFSDPLVMELPDEVPNFLNWPGQIVSASPEGPVRFLVGAHISPFDQRYRVLVLVSRKLVDGKVNLYVFAISTARLTKEGGDVENILWFGDRSYLEGGLPTHKLVRLDTAPDLKKTLALQLKSAGSKI